MIDAHVHAWQLDGNGCRWPTPDLKEIYRDHAIEDVRPVAQAAGISGLLLVQSQEDEADTMWLLRQASRSPFVRGVVGWTDLRAPELAGALAAFAAAGPLKGIRIMAQDRDASHLDVADWTAGLRCLVERMLVLDLLVRPHHLAASHKLASANPELRIVIDHCAKPAMLHEDLAAWRSALAPLAALPNVRCKLSGLVTELGPDQPVGAILPVVETVLALFGPERLIWGSDWPVLNLRSDYDRWLAFARAAIPARHHAAIFGGNARRCYRLDA